MLETKYEHKSVEEWKYERWLKNDYFKSGDLTKEPFTIVIPPPNVTGKLHLGHAWDWENEYALNIRNQWAKLGLSLDYSKERFTLDEGLSDAVKKVFVTLYNEGLIYRGEKIINWDPEAMTALSNEEVIYKDVKGAFII